ncbi:MAG: formylmethanofuran dehydrogenase subunit C [Methanoculleus sp.]
MKTVTLTLENPPELYLEGQNITPDNFAGKTAAEIAAIEIWEAKLKSPLGKHFAVAGNGGATAADTKIVLRGDCTRVKRIGQQMTAGDIVVEGNADMYIGGWMKGGKIHVKGNVDSFCGIGMEGGELIVDGNAGHHLGSSPRGEWRGMQGGVIRVAGDAGNDTGTFINGGTIIIGGDADIHISTHGEGGTVIVKGNAKGRVGGQMVKGDIYVFGEIENPLPGFQKIGEVEQEVDGVKGRFAHHIGDLGERHPVSKGKTVYANLYTQI